MRARREPRPVADEEGKAGPVTSGAALEVEEPREARNVPVRHGVRPDGPPGLPCVETHRVLLGRPSLRYARVEGRFGSESIRLADRSSAAFERAVPLFNWAETAFIRPACARNSGEPFLERGHSPHLAAFLHGAQLSTSRSSARHAASAARPSRGRPEEVLLGDRPAPRLRGIRGPVWDRAWGEKPVGVGPPVNGRGSAGTARRRSRTERSFRSPTGPG